MRLGSIIREHRHSSKSGARHLNCRGPRSRSSSPEARTSEARPEQRRHCHTRDQHSLNVEQGVLRLDLGRQKEGLAAPFVQGNRRRSGLTE
jgi:hypothetical protein